MPLESLHELVKTLKQRVKQHGNDLKASEALTRYALIDPLLRELGWDTSDPAAVKPEYRLPDNTVPDYALLRDGSPAMMVEAKKLGTPLQGSVVSQGITYCLNKGTTHFAVTDGVLWDIYETHKPVPIEQKRVAKFDLMGQLPSEFCLKALALWRPSVQAGYVATGQTPIINKPELIVQPTIITPPPTVTTPPSGDWHPLPTVNPAGNKPAEILFPDGKMAKLTAWNSVPTESARWLANQGLLSPSHCPIKLGKAKRYIVHSEPIHSDGKEFTSQKKIDSDLYVEVNHQAATNVKNTIFIVNHVGQDPAQFKVRFD